MSRYRPFLAAIGLAGAALSSCRNLPLTEPVLQSSRYDPTSKLLDDLSGTIHARLESHLDLLERTSPDQVDLAPRFIDPDSGEPRRGDANLRFALHGALRYLMFGVLVQGHEPHLVRDTALIHRWLDRRHGALPAFDIGCAGPYFLYGYLRSFDRPDEAVIRKSVEKLMSLRLPDGGWINLDYTHQRTEDAAPRMSSNEVNPTAIAALIAAGLPLDDPVITAAWNANDKSILAGAYKAEYPPDYIVGNALTLLLEKKAGIRNVDAYLRVRKELVEFVRGGKKEGMLYPLAIALLGLQGLLPEESLAYRSGMGSLLQAYDPKKAAFIEERSSIFGSEFVHTMSFQLVPYLLLKREGYEGRAYHLPGVEEVRARCAQAAPTELRAFLKWKRLRVEIDRPALLETMTEPFEEVRVHRLKPGPHAIRLDRPAWFRIHGECRGNFMAGPWYQ